MTFNRNAQYVPDICDRVYHKDRKPRPGYGGDTFRVNSWLKTHVEEPFVPSADDDPMTRLVAEILADLKAEQTPEEAAREAAQIKLVSCTREEAEYVSAYGICGVIWKLSDCVITGKVKWDPEHIEDERRRAHRNIGRTLVIDRR